MHQIGPKILNKTRLGMPMQGPPLGGIFHPESPLNVLL